jgi:hypothetical protein
MSPLTIGLLYGAATVATLSAGIAIAFALGAVAVGFMIAPWKAHTRSADQTRSRK